jgi:hypothetical protein
MTVVSLASAAAEPPPDAFTRFTSGEAAVDATFTLTVTAG